MTTLDALILADDLTGGNATAALCARAGRPVLTAFDHALLGSRLAAVTVFDTETRSLTPAAAERVVARLAAQLDLSRPGLLALRIDSTLRGNWGVEIAALLAGRAAPDLVVVTPAYPEVGRRCEGGRVTVDGRPLADVMAGHAGVRGALGLLLGLGALLLIEYLDPTIRSARELERLLQVPVMGEIPQEG